MAIVASVDREVDALQRELEQTKWALIRSKAAMMSVCRWLWNVDELKTALGNEDFMYAQQLWEEIDMKDQEAMMIAPSKGGVFTTKERSEITKFWSCTFEEYEASKR